MLPRRKWAVERRFVRQVQADLEAAGYQFIIHPNSSIGAVNCAGVFDPDRKVLELAAGDAKWFQTLVHEYGHFEQTMAGLWTSPAELALWEMFDSWLLGSADSEEDPEQILLATRIIQACERDAENRVLQRVQRGLCPSMDFGRYCRGANGYVLQYEAARRTRLWPRSRPIFLRNSTLLAMMPADRLVENLGELPEGYLQLYCRYAEPLGRFRVPAGS